MSDLLPSRHPTSPCSYCGQPVDERLYFCPRCAKPYKPPPETVLPASLPPYEDDETRLRTKSGPAWTVFFSYLIVIGLGSMIAFSIWGDEDWEPAFLFLDFSLLVTTLIFASRFWSDLRPLLLRPALFHSGTWIGLALLAPLLALSMGAPSQPVKLLTGNPVTPPPGLSNENWYSAENGEQNGPYSFALLVSRARQGTLSPDTFVWVEGLAEWTPASQVQGLFTT